MNLPLIFYIDFFNILSWMKIKTPIYVVLKIPPVPPPPPPVQPPCQTSPMSPSPSTTSLLPSPWPILSSLHLLHEHLHQSRRTMTLVRVWRGGHVLKSYPPPPSHYIICFSSPLYVTHPSNSYILCHPPSLFDNSCTISLTLSITSS